MNMSPLPNLILGIDLGGTNTAFGVIDPCGKILCRGSIPTTGHADFADFIRSLHNACKSLLKSYDIPYEAIAAVGVGAPCLNYSTGVIEGAVNLPWPSPLKLTEALTAEFGIPAAGENDANAAALGEMHFGAGKGLDNFIMLTLGTGVGGAIICDGRLLHGHRGLAGELGHIPVCNDEKARPCNCGRRGCLDAYASARGIIATAKEMLDASDAPSQLRAKPDFNAKDVGEAADAGDEIALATFRFTGELLGKACADFTAFSSPEAVVFFGGVAASFPHFEKSMKDAFNKNLLWIYENQVRFMPSALPAADAALLGAAAAAKSLIGK